MNERRKQNLNDFVKNRQIIERGLLVHYRFKVISINEKTAKVKMINRNGSIVSILMITAMRLAGLKSF